MSQAADLIRQPVTAVFDLFSDSVTYRQGATVVVLRMSIRSMKADELFGSAAQGDRLGVVRAQEFDAKVGAAPERYGRVEVGTTQYTVQDWKPAPATGLPIFYRMVLRGGTQ